MSRPTRGLASAATLYVFFFLLLAAPIALAFDPNFDFYPADAESCLLDAAKASKCQGDSPKALNACLCGNGGGFVVRAAQCLGKKDKKDVGSVYDTMADACAHSGTPLKVDKDDFADAADDGSKSSSSSSRSSSTATKTSSSSTSASNTASKTPSSSSTSTTPSATTSSTASPTASPDGSKKLSTAGTIGVAAGVSVAGVAAIAGLAWFLVRRRKRSTAADEAHPMLAQEKYGGSGGGGGGGATTFPPHDPSPSLGGGGGGFGRETKSHYSVSTFSSAHPRQSYAALSSVSPDPQQHNFLAAWEPPASASYNSSPRNSAAYVGPYAAPQHQQQAQPVLAELPPQTQARPVSNIFELESSAVAEAPAPLELPQAASQPVWQQQQQHTREYRPYIPK
ncbi:hypothetical protein LMH87_007043 [Akanthomyces muscarius]|uniref:Extracellular membrane protein CFEM domain-containing protein n=1 Tax=Akanthomyces muscarius TaxID=2231603 RepID=A0A9W8QS05_AKAMU|nr:hypothetical protein LMH87_007043 [Akanthomyces muscarius]KAJ4165409.1 hypothetical protein LMH87_007043 [Akanthomyces muscarius]